jgi:membrane-bound serine protease (ClpP class)
MLLATVSAGALHAQSPAPPRPTAALLTVHDAISPATADYVTRGIDAAATSGAALIVIEMDTPGGLDSAMRNIIQAILASPVPVVTFVAPQGARAASAGTYILYASHVAAMAPATNLGAATPVSIGGPSGEPSPTPTPTPEQGSPGTTPQDNQDSQPATSPEPTTAMERKAINDAVAYIRSLAERRGRNADWAETAVRSAASLSAQAALEMGVIDLIAEDLQDLLQKLDGRTVTVGGREVTLATTGLVYERIDPDWRTKLLAVISNPTVAYILMLIGIYGLIFEGYNPGAVVPGVVGAISLLLALFAFQILPVNYAGLALIALGVILMIAEFMVPSFGALGLGGIVAFVFGSVILVDSDLPGYGVSIPLVGSIALTASLALLGTVWFAMRSRGRPVVSGAEELVGADAKAMESFEHEGEVWIHSERWHARSTQPVTKGQMLRVTRVEGLTLHVEPGARE